MTRVLPTTNFTRCGRDRFAGSRPRVYAAKDRGRRAHREVCFRAPPRAATTTIWLAAKTPPAKSSRKIHVGRHKQVL
jgi:hypothetical protein